MPLGDAVVNGDCESRSAGALGANDGFRCLDSLIENIIYNHVIVLACMFYLFATIGQAYLNYLFAIEFPFV